ncbi:MAG: DUF5723 family protein [Flavobacteriales bacterium]
MKRILTTLLATASFSYAVAQTANPLIQYGFDGIPNAIQLNPAFQPQKNIFVALPVLGGINLSAFSSDLSFEDVIRRENSSTTFLDRDNLSLLIKDKSFINVQLSTDLLYGGIRAYNGGYWSFGVQERVELDIQFSDDFMDMTLYGNFDDKVYNKWLDFSELKMSANAQTRLHVGYSKDLNKRVRVGGRMHLISGLLHAGISDNSLQFKTDRNAGVPNTIRTRGELYMSVAGIQEGDDKVKMSPINSKNIGLGLDLGIDYMYNKKLYLAASVTDIGFIRWKDNVKKVGVNISEDWKYDGFVYEPNDSNDLGDRIDEWSNNVGDDMNFDTLSDDAFTTYLNTTMYLSGKYRFSKKHALAATFKGELGHGRFQPGFAVNYQTKVISFLDLLLGASYLDNQTSLSTGFNLNIGKFNWFILTDHASQLANLKGTKGVNISTGMNVQFGMPKKKKNFSNTRWMEDEDPKKKEASAKKKKKKKKKKEKTSSSKKGKSKKAKKEKEKKSKNTVKDRTKKKKRKNDL